MYGWPKYRVQFPAAQPWLLSLFDLVFAYGPLIAVLVITGRMGASAARRARLFRMPDLVMGVGLGLVLRAAVELVAPTAGSLWGPLGADTADQTRIASLVVAVLAVVALAPVVEELFFRGLVLRSTAAILAGFGRLPAAIVAIALSTAAFVVLHLVAASGSMATGAWLAAVGVGLGCGILTAWTGRVGGAIVAHVVFNAIGLALLLS